MAKLKQQCPQADANPSLSDDEQTRLDNIVARWRADRRPKRDVSTSVLDRARLFQPTTAPKCIDTFDVPDVVPGVCTTSVQGCLGQTEQALLEAILLRAVDKGHELKTGGKRIRVKAAALRSDLGITGETGKYTGDLAKSLNRLKEARFRLENFGGSWGRPYKRRPAPNVVQGTFIKDWRADHINGTGRGNAGNDVMLTIVLDSAYLLLLRHDQARFRHLRFPIRAFVFGVSMAVARWLMSHDPDEQPNGGWKPETAIEAVCGELCPARHLGTEKEGSARMHAIRRERSRLASEPAEIWAACGIELRRVGKSFRFELFRDSNGKKEPQAHH